jgi:hypothetical protein
MTQVTVTEAELGQVIATDSVLTDVVIVTVPTDYGSYLTLVDDSLGQEKVILNVNISISHVSIGSDLLSNGSVYFENLTLKSIPVGSSFQIDYEPPPTEELPPPEQVAEPASE